MYGFEHEKYDRSLPRDADGFLQMSDQSPTDIQALINRAHVMRSEHMAETLKSLARSARSRLREFGQTLHSLQADRPLNRFGQSPNWF